jgi:hypothetical protein
MRKPYHPKKIVPEPSSRRLKGTILALLAIVVAVGYFLYSRSRVPSASSSTSPQAVSPVKPGDGNPAAMWVERAHSVDGLFHDVYTPCWEGAYGAIGDAYLFAATNDSSLLRFHTVDHDLRKMCTGTWVDDRAWVCLAELVWWHFSGERNRPLVDDARRRYTEARREGRLSNDEGYWSWYNWPPHSVGRGRIFTNSNMNQMASVACRLYQATGEKSFLDDALLVWNGDKTSPGIEKVLYKGDGLWEGTPGPAAFGKQLPWEGAEYCSLGALLYRATGDERYKSVVIATAARIMSPAGGWVDPQDFYQIHMDGNGAFVNYILDAYAVAPAQMADVLKKVELMLEHVWTNHEGRATVTLHRESDHGIRNGWNPYGGEDGYGVDEIGTVHAQGEAARAFGIFAYYKTGKL